MKYLNQTVFSFKIGETPLVGWAKFTVYENYSWIGITIDGFRGNVYSKSGLKAD